MAKHKHPRATASFIAEGVSPVPEEPYVEELCPKEPYMDGPVEDENIAIVEEIVPQMCPYLSPIVKVYVGADQTEFSVHQDMISSLDLPSSSTRYYGSGLQAKEIDPPLFELLLTFLYRGDYRDYVSKSNPIPLGADADAKKLRNHVLLYWIGHKHGIAALKSLAKNNIESSESIDYQSFLCIAIEGYEIFQDDDPWFMEYLNARTKEAIDKNSNLAKEAWIVDIIRSQTTILAAHLFSIFTANSVRLPVSLDNVQCELRDQHLKVFHEKNGPWKSCKKCTRERKEMTAAGRAMMSVAFDELWPSFSRALPENQRSLPKKEKKRVQKELRTALCSLPISPILSSMEQDPPYEKCPNQAAHLTKNGDLRLWENCSACSHGHKLILDKIQQMDVGKNFLQRDTEKCEATNAISESLSAQETGLAEIGTLQSSPFTELLNGDLDGVEGFPCSSSLSKQLLTAAQTLDMLMEEHVPCHPVEEISQTCDAEVAQTLPAAVSLVDERAFSDEVPAEYSLEDTRDSDKIAVHDPMAVQLLPEESSPADLKQACKGKTKKQLKKQAPSNHILSKADQAKGKQDWLGELLPLNGAPGQAPVEEVAQKSVAPNKVHEFETEKGEGRPVFRIDPIPDVDLILGPEMEEVEMACNRRTYHLQQEYRWTECFICRSELDSYAKTLACDANARGRWFL